MLGANGGKQLTSYITDGFRALVRRALQSDGDNTITKSQGNAHEVAPRFKSEPAIPRLVLMAAKDLPTANTGPWPPVHEKGPEVEHCSTPRARPSGATDGHTALETPRGDGGMLGDGNV